MAFDALNFYAALWRGRGLRWLAAPGPVSPELSLCTPAREATTCDTGACGTGGQARRAGNGRPTSGPERSFPAASCHDGISRAQAGRPAAAPEAGHQTRPRPDSRNRAGTATVPRESLPRAWRERLEATRPALVAWTYWNLAQDMAASPGQGGDEAGRAGRRAVLQRLLRDLAHPAGTHTFWPACLPSHVSGAAATSAGHDAPAVQVAPAGGGECACQPDADAFWNGAALLGCRCVIVMGSHAARALGLPDTVRPLEQLRWRGQLVLVLWEPDYLTADPARYRPALAFLRQALRPLARRAAARAVR